ncbi:MAG TPA: ribonuclease HII [Candidatus Coproplasma stercoripullorum]|uniref:Ribonuclease HII n=1 Tax=Candidatus Coproplasma stercoripullorum TaxID=2840751 RepID=A0A9D1AFU8_9FIRM|nr:ribonuclease HII [Candidatus Coproplasma stercoripullorum]
MDKLFYERELKNSGYNLICGADEVGRGPLAGPVVCAAVIMPEGDIIEGVDDSKKLTARKREKLDVLIRERAVAYAVCRVEPQVIDEINILEATKLCMKNAVESLEISPDFVLTDGNMTLDITIPQRHVIGGDAASYSIGAASIIAKVYRDKLMDEYAALYPGYGFESNKGYGTAAHIAAIMANGLCPIHRRSFTKKWQ